MKKSLLVVLILILSLTLSLSVSAKDWDEGIVTYEEDYEDWEDGGCTSDNDWEACWDDESYYDEGDPVDGDRYPEIVEDESYCDESEYDDSDYDDYEYQCEDVEPMYMVAICRANVRSGPGTSFSIVDFINKGEDVVVIGEAYDCSGKHWYRCSDGNYITAGALVSEYEYTQNYQYTDETGCPEDSSSENCSVSSYKVVRVGANVRSGPSTSYQVVNYVDAGTCVGIYYEESGWYFTNQGGWIAAYLFDESYHQQEEEQEDTSDNCSVSFYRVVQVGANVRSGPGTSYQVVNYVDAGTCVGIYYEQDGWYKTDRGGWIAAYLFDEQSHQEQHENDNYCNYGTCIVVVIDEQMVYLYRDGELITSDPCVTGRDGMETPRGVYQIIEKDTNRTLTDYKTYEVEVEYWIRFHEGYGVHSASWRENFGGDIYRNYGSHGCVNMDYDSVRCIYNNTELGDYVIVK